MSATETKAPPAAGTGPRKLEGRVALVTGGTRGIGAAICHSMAAQGATVAAGYSSNTEAAEQHLKAIEKDGGTGSIHQGNVGVFDDCQRVVKDVIEQHGRLDILVNNAGATLHIGPLADTPPDVVRATVDLNLTSALRGARAAVRALGRSRRV